MTEEIEERVTEPGSQQDSKRKGTAGQGSKHDSQSEVEGEDVILFVEYKYCTVCHIE